MNISLNTITQSLAKTRIMPLLTLKDSSIAPDIAKSLIEGGIKVVEVTFRTEAGAQAIEKIKNSKLPILVGAGTVRTFEQAQKAVDCGADFLVTPGFNPLMIKWAQDHQIAIFPGVDSTIAIEQAINANLNFLKFFPAEIGGIKWLKAIYGPYPEISFICTGGISLANLKEYLTQPNVLGIAGSFLCPSDAIARKDFPQITEICKDAKKIVESI